MLQKEDENVYLHVFSRVSEGGDADNSRQPLLQWITAKCLPLKPAEPVWRKAGRPVPSHGVCSLAKGSKNHISAAPGLVP